MIDREQLELWWNTFIGEGNFTEVRILGRFQYSGYFRSFDKLISQLEPFTDMDDEQIYFVLNSIDSQCYARPQCEKFIKSPKATTNDNDIIRRRFLLLDFDPIRKSQTNSSPEQFELAHKKAQEVYRYLRDKGFTDSIICVSGNGYHIIVAVDLPCDDETDKIIKNFYTYMGSIFSDDNVEFDEKVYTRARLTKLYSTWAKKGANVPSNPWRQSKIVYIPKQIVPTPLEKIKEIADLLPKEEPKPTALHQPYTNYNQPFNIVSWLNEHGIVYREEKQGISTKYVLEHCPWEDTHSTIQKWESALFVDADGKITFSCFHAHCKDKTWREFRLFYEPDAYDRPVYQTQFVPSRQYTQQKQEVKKPQIKEVIPELGDKWLTMSQIEDVDLSALSGFKTGITELDRMIIKLYGGEISILSGNNASGKTSWLNTLILNVLNQGEKCALWSGELKGFKLKAWIHQAAAGKANLKPSQYNDGKFFVPPMIRKKITEWMEDKFFLYNNKYGSKWEQIFHDMKILVGQGVKLFVLDNLFSLDIDILEGDKNNKQKELILQLSDFVKEEGVHAILVAHPRKVMTFLRKNDICGTSDLQNAVDNIFIIHRVNQDFFRAGAEFFGKQYIESFRDYGNVIEVAKNRMWGVVDLLVGMHYEIESRRFKNSQEEVITYGWERQAEQTNMNFEPTPPHETRNSVHEREYGGESKEIDDDMPFAPPPMDANDAPF